MITAIVTQAQIYINEIHYNPPEDGLQEFIELYNPTSRSIRLDGYVFTEGILYEFPRRAIIPANNYFVLARDPNHSAFRNVSALAGPYIGKLADSGERILLRDANGEIVDEFKYSDAAPWPIGPDGYGSSLEKISPELPSDDYKNWRTSLSSSGTPGAQNSVFGESPDLYLNQTSHSPQHPTSNDFVTITSEFDGASIISSVKLYLQTFNTRRSGGSAASTYAMERQSVNGDVATYSVRVPPQDSQRLVRYKFEMKTNTGGTVYWPHRSAARPYESYFVYDNEIETLLPLFWVYYSILMDLPESQGDQFGGGVFKPLDGPPQVYDGASVYDSRNGKKIKFLKGQEFEGNRTLNILPESPPAGTTSGPQTPHVEQVSYKIFESFGLMVPGAEWYRAIQFERHEQILLIQQPNENFLELNDRNRDANIYKVAYNVPNGIQKQTNLDEDQSDLNELNQAIRVSGAVQREEGLRKFLDVENVMNYSVAGCLMSNWDGFFNNMFLYHAPAPANKWECIPWDCDKTFGYTEPGVPMFVEMPVDFPLNGFSPRNGRPEGYISGPFHRHEPFHEEYKRRVRREMTRRFSTERVQELCDQYEQLLLTDLALEEQYTGSKDNLRRSQIVESYDTIMEFTERRLDFLDGVLPVSVDDWALMD
ncbi:MAG: CotH kinase family protein [Candidatus Hinthialibacter antarcticus]|nr:CotH kinase family protein [Candidatus Hinthialibacter antarcticus]